MAHDFEPRNQKNACPFDKKWERNVARDDGWKSMGLNLDVESVFIPREVLLKRSAFSLKLQPA